MMNDHSESEPIIPNDAADRAPAGQQPDAVPIDTAQIQEALEKRVDQETAVLPQLTMPGANAKAPGLQQKDAADSSRKAKKRRTKHTLNERWWTPSVRSWFFTFMCMNMPIVGWFYLFHEARQEEDPARKEFARAYLFYKLVFLIAGAIVLLILIWIGLGLLDQLLAYMEML